MAIVGLGTDIIEVSRIEKSLARGDSLTKRVLTPKEQEEMSASVDEAAYLAKRFAAKEACAKAFGRGISAGLSFQHMQVVHDDYGKPSWHFTDTAAEWIKEMGVVASHLSISDEKHYAVATVILESE
ncbi:MULTISPECIES: holo-ACP synthase [Idiomarina]|jgi:holo-[acyl-carrier protein] synthase|uniref:Holo-[acyl-carrier-protein] synthase n=1 Tax=Idiomarina piscisalsi TaxID=1096243 RepID=A0ABM6LU60_9GAMM|nr:MULTISPECIES: holo-ACP synthase [Idiomarina]KTG23884.1 ACP synthase [Idiomarina sp. H105]OAE91275.1 ACP synthase [Idiomarina sp. WRN-38]ASG65969.1 holo-ACP synthase [Idiomarina piscisalsi]MCJ8315574.1 holo-ACP synthase [Idiomarina sp.]MTJ02939.1 holo-ACP synthase [Idiomarina piscisalsi]|tara:strand:+ start:11575 stop:11955 length:381 start_codon:yes stop_codon:yes gene_type:complete